ncbi:glutathione S-transferase [Falsirhodobacter sp. 20TX0035]|uniref:glutathione S-transferase n=1 Tax=Falsirhodobacter sp. 20TX0035 TaxID=3022019 RepID=UPI00232F5341|nr:glutathione S-transferase [Falsirhodobacter sp. 20TX0035]MDB6452215.1 glutathione S-transferase [Falsirhodobacter sp. 20TX0035]
MGWTLAIGERCYSSWSLRGWLLFDAFGLPVTTVSAPMYTSNFARVLQDFAPARTAPAARLGEVVVWDSLAIAEELASRHPGAGHWPQDPAARAAARSMAAEMHSGFTALRGHCAMNLRTAYRDVPVPEAVRADLDRIEASWARSGDGWLFGDYSAADAFFAPVALRIAGHGLPVGPVAQAYVARHLAHPSLRRWRALGRAIDPVLPAYDRDWPQVDWPGPAPLPARAVEGTEAENAACPYSGKPVTHVLELDGRRWGFCNATCRDKTMNDPEAWPAFMAMIR